MRSNLKDIQINELRITNNQNTMTAKAYVKILEKRMESRKKALDKLSKGDYFPFSYKDYNAYYIQEEMKFIKGIIDGVIMEKPYK